ncbi:MAG: hypothetical protein ACTHKJ_05340 [Candidatus Nitrosocosmicus sp.]
MELEDNPSNTDVEAQQKTTQVSTRRKISSLFAALSNGPSAFQLNFKDRYFAANILAATIQDRMANIANKDNVVVLEI